MSMTGVTGIILAGGESRRMGQDKAWLEVDGVSLIERVLSIMREVFSEVMIVTRWPDRFAPLGALVGVDVVSGAHAMGGVYTGLLRMQTEHGFVVACDMPFLSAVLIRHLTVLAPGHDVVFPISSQGLHPLHAVYSKHCLPWLRVRIARRRYQLHGIEAAHSSLVVDVESLPDTLHPTGCLDNVNTPREWSLSMNLRRPTQG